MFKHTCIHYTGGLDDTHCAARVEYAAVTPQPNANGSAYRKPCILWDQTGRKLNDRAKAEYARRGSCPKFQLPTDEEQAAFEVETTNLLIRLQKVQPLITQVQESHRGENWSGVFDCPACGAAQSLTIGVARNGHTRGVCRTGGECLLWQD